MTTVFRQPSSRIMLQVSVGLVGIGLLGHKLVPFSRCTAQNGRNSQEYVDLRKK
jgi:hypothetical protein